MEFIKSNEVYKSFPVWKKTVSVLRNVNFTINEGEFVVLVGASGSGKTTLLNLIAGLDMPSYGQITVGGEDLSKLTIDELCKWRAKNIGVIFQNYNLMPYMTAIDNVALPLVFQGIGKQKRIEKARSLLKSVGLQSSAHSPCQVLSGGEQQRVTIARAIINEPKILIADEPTGDLDPHNAEEVAEIIYTLYKERKTTIIMATHNIEYKRFADRVFQLNDGRLGGAK